MPCSADRVSSAYRQPVLSEVFHDPRKALVQLIVVANHIAPSETPFTHDSSSLSQRCHLDQSSPGRFRVFLSSTLGLLRDSGAISLFCASSFSLNSDGTDGIRHHRTRHRSVRD